MMTTTMTDYDSRYICWPKVKSGHAEASAVTSANVAGRFAETWASADSVAILENEPIAQATTMTKNR